MQLQATCDSESNWQMVLLAKQGSAHRSKAASDDVSKAVASAHDGDGDEARGGVTPAEHCHQDEHKAVVQWPLHGSNSNVILQQQGTR